MGTKRSNLFLLMTILVVSAEAVQFNTETGLFMKINQAAKVEQNTPENAGPPTASETGDDLTPQLVKRQAVDKPSEESSEGSTTAAPKEKQKSSVPLPPPPGPAFPILPATFPFPMIEPVQSPPIPTKARKRIHRRRSETPIAWVPVDLLDLQQAANAMEKLLDLPIEENSRRFSCQME
ncbi:uncharacterized protein LOC129774899 [Toxorhynchites rutilus septentrionalis]|uniref:uncharacterized protein LOC129774899 n=1 Tax=Toxorhynchites rutilus septentrionalis TaxID=329112 RepID=UPI00247953E1|nr:uncharacterized protein LOC129774899 [Toxorhynchites rutilus septentrionalis]